MRKKKAILLAERDLERQQRVLSPSRPSLVGRLLAAVTSRSSATPAQAIQGLRDEVRID